MEGLLTFTGCIIIVFGILQIILFFKIWGMTNDVSRIKDLLESKRPNSYLVESSVTTNMQENNVSLSGEDENTKTPCNINIGDSIIRLSDGKKMVVDSIDNNQYFCKVSFMEGYKYFQRDEIKAYRE